MDKSMYFCDQQNNGFILKSFEKFLSQWIKNYTRVIGVIIMCNCAITLFNNLRSKRNLVEKLRLKINLVEKFKGRIPNGEVHAYYLFGCTMYRTIQLFSFQKDFQCWQNQNFLQISIRHCRKLYLDQWQGNYILNYVDKFSSKIRF